MLRKLSEALSALERQGMIELRWLERTALSALDDAISAPPTLTSCLDRSRRLRQAHRGRILVLEHAHGGRTR